MLGFHNAEEAIAWLRSPEAIRARSEIIFALAERDQLDHFALDTGRLGRTAEFVIETTKAVYPDLEVPYHSRWRHFSAGGIDRWDQLASQLAGVPPEEIARIRIDLAVVSVLLDAGAGERWNYVEPPLGAVFRRSEGLAVASIRSFATGTFSGLRHSPLRVDARVLRHIDEEILSNALQVTGDNPIVGLSGRVRMLRQLGKALEAHPELFGTAEPRPGNLFDFLVGQADRDRLPVTTIFSAVLTGLAQVWHGPCSINGANLGDVGSHSAIVTHDVTRSLIPFHKLPQWLTYSLVEPLQDAGMVVTELDALTGLAEYRNGGLLVDLEVLRPKHSGIIGEVLAVDSEVVVEWRALTVALLDRLVVRVRESLGLDETQFPLVKLLEGGTWSAGRRIALQRREGGIPPITVETEGTVF